MPKLLYILFVLTIIAVSCKKSKPAPNLNLNYFGMTEGRYLVYDVKEITNDFDGGLNDTVFYQLKTYWADTFVDNEGRIAREFLRYKRNVSSDPWSLQDTWTGYIDNNTRGEIVEENQRVVKVLFRPSFNKTWDANAYNQMGKLELSYDDIHIAYNANGTNFDSTIIIKSNIEPSAIDTTTHEYIYAANIGLVEQSIRSRQYQLNNQGFYLDKGKEVFYRFVESGIE